MRVTPPAEAAPTLLASLPGSWPACSVELMPALKLGLVEVAAPLAVAPDAPAGW